MDTREVAEAFTQLCKDKKYEDAEAQFWADDVVSIEAMPGEMSHLQGREAIKQKHAWWEQNFEVHSESVTGPMVNGDQFSVIYEMDVTQKDNGERSQMKEVALYTVKDGKIIEERFFY